MVGFDYWGRRTGESPPPPPPSLSNAPDFEARFRGAQQGQNDTREAVTGIYNQQIAQTNANREASLADRDKALEILRSKIGVRSQTSEDTLNTLNTDFTDTPFTRMVQSSIAGTLANPDVISRDQIAQFTARSKESASIAVQDAIRSSTTQNAQRGVQGGITQQTENDLTQQATAGVIGQTRQLEMDAAQARATNLSTAQQLGVTLEGARYQANSARISALAGFVSAGEARDFELISGMAEILANTVRQNPDLSGYASLLVDFQQSSNDLLVNRENIITLRQQIEQSERLGLDSNAIQAQLVNAQQRTASAIEQARRFQRGWTI